MGILTRAIVSPMYSHRTLIIVIVALIGCAAMIVALYEPEVLRKVDVGFGFQSQKISKSKAPPPVSKTLTVIGNATTSFSGSSLERTQNITEGARRLDGKVVNDGEEFSLIAALEPLDEGYEYEFVIGSTMSVKEPGGGLCQISTTLFRALLDAGLPITERQPHRYVVGYYGAGLDATIYGPHPDLRFKNDTGSPITIRAVVEGTDVRIDLEGISDGRIASTSAVTLYDNEEKPPLRYFPSAEVPFGTVHCTEVSREGVTSDVTYSVLYPDGQQVSTVFHSKYQAWPGVCYVGIGVF